MPSDRTLHEDNRRSWNEATRAHNAHKGDQAAFFRDGGTTLFPEETSLLGDLTGQRLVHLQCNAGQDTLSLLHLHPADVLGVDISDEAIAFARTLAAESQLPARFERADIYDFLEAAAPAGSFDVAFSSYGALGWLSDIALWARGIAAALAPGGRLCLVEFHPILQMYDDLGVRSEPYFGDGRVFSGPGVGDYVADSGAGLCPGGFVDTPPFANPHPCHGFQWTLAETITAILDAGLVLDVFHEYSYSNGCRFFPDMTELPGRRYAMPPGQPSLPLMFALAAHKPTASPRR